jgi:outer membrane immunogenic protein
MKPALARPLAFALLAALATPAFAQSGGGGAWTGGYLGVQVGSSDQPGDDSETIRFDRNLDNNFGDTVTTASGANAFSPGFCGGAANGPTPASGCRDDDSGTDVGVRAGYDWQSGMLVYGIVGEYVRGDAEDSVSAFSTTPARYTMTRSLERTASLRGRIGFSFGDDANLLYATGGLAWGRVSNSFSTSNGVNTFTNNGDSDSKGPQYGLGYERKLGDKVAVGLEYLVTKLTDDEYRVRAQGPAPATNPFILGNPSGTDFRRGDEDFETSSLRLTLSYRF